MKKSVAVIGVSGIFQKSNDINSWWDNLRTGKELYDWYSEDDLRAAGISESEKNDPNFVSINTTLEEAKMFDASFFGYSQKEAEFMDPQTRLLHQQVWLGLEDAGYDPAIFQKKIGLIVSASENLPWKIKGQITENTSINAYFQSVISNVGFSNTLISYKLNLKGPSYFIDTACSSSLVGIHLAVRQLLMREANMFVVGGASLNVNTNKSYTYQDGMIYSSDGKCRAFDEKASGTFAGEGGGVVVLKRLEDALKDEDRIYAVIRGSATNNDGNIKVGYTAPSVNGQSSCIKLAHQVAGVSSDTISYVETHGTATSQGDPIEIEALNIAFDKKTEKHCAIGSVKSNVGHLDAAAGVTGFLKSILSIHHKEIPASLHFETPNPNINFDGGPFYVNDKLKQWERVGDTPLRAGISSFGIGGTNAHVIIEEAPEYLQSDVSEESEQLLMISAKSKPSLEMYLDRLADYLKNNSNISLANLAFTLNRKKASMPFKTYFVAKDLDDLLNQLQSEKSRNIHHLVETNVKKRIVFMFPGQGSQYSDMALDLYKNDAFFKSIIDSGLEILRSITGKDFGAVLFPSLIKSDDAGDIKQTSYTQPLIFLVEYALAKLLIKKGIKPDIMIGHSIGEYAAACISNVFNFEEALKLVVNRGALMNSMEAGAMLSVDCLKEDLIPLIDENVSIAAVNSAKSIVLSGTFEAIDKIAEKLEKEDIAIVRLKVSHAFHSEMMDPILEDYLHELEKVDLKNPTIPFVSNLTGQSIKNDEAISPKYWVAQLRNTVSFADGLSFLNEQGYNTFLEVGPGMTLSNLYHQNKLGAKDTVVINFMRHPKIQENDSIWFAKQLGRAIQNGVKMDWIKYYSDQKLRHLSIPGYAFERIAYPIDIDIYSHMSHLFGSNVEEKAPFDKWFYTSNWKLAKLKMSNEGLFEESNFLLFSNADDFSNQLVEELSKQSKSLIIVKQGKEFAYLPEENTYVIDPWNKDDYQALAKALNEKEIQINQFTYCWSLQETENLDSFDSNNNITKELNRDFFHCLNIIQAFELQYSDNPNKFAILTNLNASINEGEKIDFTSSSAIMLSYVAMQESTNNFNVTIDLDLKKDNQVLVKNLVSDLIHNTREINIAYRDGRRWAKFHEHKILDQVADNEEIKKEGVYLITGGLGNAALCLAKHLLTKYQAKVILMGRSKMPDNLSLESLESLEEVRKYKLKSFIELQNGSGTLDYLQGDVSNQTALSEVVDSIEAKYGHLNGVLHTAGNLELSTHKVVENVNVLDAEAQFAPKVNGIVNLYNVLKNRNLQFVWVTSSLSSILGGLTYASYAAANTFMDHFIEVLGIQGNQKWISARLDGLSFGGDNELIGEEDLVDIFEHSVRGDKGEEWIVSIKDFNARDSFYNKAFNPILASNNGSADMDSLTSNAPSDMEIEETLIRLWKDFFDRETIDLDESFFELGGNSLKIIVMHKEIQKHWNVNIKVATLFTLSSINDISTEIRKMMETEETKEVNTNNMMSF